MSEPTRIHDVEEQPTEIIGPEGNGKAPSSLIGHLRELQAEQAADKFYDLEVPGYRGCLVIRLNPMRASQISKLQQRAEKSKSPDKDLNANSDVLISGCREVLGREHRDHELGPVDPDNDPTRIDEHLAEILQLGTTTARSSLLALWDKANSPEIAIGLSASEYIEWSSDTQSELDEEFVGKA